MLSSFARETLNKSLQHIASREDHIRQSTITFNTDAEITHKDITKLICKEWGSFSTTFKSDKKSLFVEFNDKDAKFLFIKKIMFTSKESHKIIYSLVRPNYAGHYFTRKSIRLEIRNMKPFVIAQDITSRLVAYDFKGAVFFGESEGKIMQDRTRTIFFNTNGAGFELIFSKLQGSFLIRTTLEKIQPKLNMKPKICNDCFQITNNNINGNENEQDHHDCDGKVCYKCGSKNHYHSETNCCVQWNGTKTEKICLNCQRKSLNCLGHDAIDRNCPLVLDAIVRELRTLDIPIKFFANRNLREILINSRTYYYNN